MSRPARVGKALTGPAQRALDKRVEWTISLIDDRLGLHDRERPTVHDRIDELEVLARLQLLALGLPNAEMGEGPTSIEALDEHTGQVIDWANGPGGFAAQAGLFFNPPVPVQHHEGSVTVLHVTERIVEQPFVFGELARAGARTVLDLGGGESTVALSLASLGMTVDVVDPRGTPVPHPNIRVHACRVDELDVTGLGPFDAAIALSAVEHFGLGHYDGDEAGRPREDVAAIARTRELLTPGGRLLLTVPFGEASEDDFQRVYDDAGLDRLLEGYVETERRIFTRTGLTEWSERRDGDGPGVALVSAARPG